MKLRFKKCCEAGREARSSRKFSKNEAGTTAIEFGFVGIPFFVLVFAILELGLTLGAQYSLDHGVSVASRLVRTGQAQGLSPTQFVSRICDSAVMLSDCENKIRLDMRSATDFQTLAGFSSASFIDGDGVSAQNDSNTGANNFSYDPGGRKTPMILTVGYEWTLVGLMGTGAAWLHNGPLNLGTLGNGNRVLMTTELFRNEPF